MKMKRSKRINVKRYDRKMATEKPADTGLDWHSPNAAPFQVAGFAWFRQDGLYRRMPRRPAHALRQAVDELANCTAGGQIRFQTDSPRIVLRVRSAPAQMDHMAVTGQCGFDCYVGAPGAQRYVSTTRLTPGCGDYEQALLNLPERAMRHITLNFPLYTGVSEVKVGLAQGARVLPPVPFARKRPIVVYGTSITQGGCAARPGMLYTNILSRKMNMEFINLGFSGSGRGEPEVARIIAEIPRPACLVLDYEANAGYDGLRATFSEFIRIIRAAHPAAPIVVVSRIRFSGELLNPAVRRERVRCRDFQCAAVADLRRQGDTRISFFDGRRLLAGDWDECTVDGVHPTDHGFAQIAAALLPVLRRAIRHC